VDRRQFLSFSSMAIGAAVLADSTWFEQSAQAARRPPKVFLTFDDGPGIGTKMTREILQREQIPATFFVVGQRAVRSQGVLKGLHRDGHSVQNHSWTHRNLAELINPRPDLDRCSNFIEDTIGVRPTYCRPPYGATNSTVEKAITSLGMKQMIWNLSATPVLAAERPLHDFVRRVRKNRLKGQPNIILFHDGTGNVEQMTEFLPFAIKTLKRFGHEFHAFT